MTEPKKMFATGLDAMIAKMREEHGPDNGENLSDAQLAQAASDLWAWAGQLRAGERAFRFAPGHDQSICLEVVGPDIPFLVDSILGECFAQQAQVRALFHPRSGPEAA